jgi:hypothetical protein
MGHVLRLGAVGAAMPTKEEEQLILEFLRGDIPQGSKDGVRAQKALARLFGSPDDLTSEILFELRRLFEAKPRRVVIKKPKEGEDLPKAWRDWGIAVWIHHRIHDGPLTKQVIADAVAEWRVSRGTITRAWTALGAPLNKQESIAVWILHRIHDGSLTEQVIADAAAEWRVSREAVTLAWTQQGKPVQKKWAEQARKVVSLKNRTQT